MVNQQSEQDRSDSYRRTSRELLSRGEAALEEEDLLQASEKLWGASAQMVKALASSRGWEHSSHRSLFQVIDRLASETQDSELRNLFLEAGQLHTNFYEQWLPSDMVRAGGQRVRILLDRLEAVL